jgi:large subunit ribosomal protein L23
MDIYDIVVRPLETEKAYLQRESGQYVFVVVRGANKLQIKHESVNVMNMPAKINHIRGRRRVTRHAPWKKAIVTLAPGERIEQLEA